MFITLKEAILGAGFTVPVFAKAVGVNKTTLYNHINNKSDVSPSLARRIIKELKGSISFNDIYYR